MATPRIPNQRKQYNKLNERLARYVLAVQSIYDDLNKQAAKIGLQSGYDGEGEFRWSDFPELRSKVEKLQTNFVTDIGALIMRGTSEEWKNSNLLQDMIADKVIKAYTGEKNRKQFTHYYQTNSSQLRAFQQRKDRGMNLSTKLWNQSEEYKRTLEDVLAVSIERGTDAITLSKRISKYLSDFDTFKNDYTEKFGKATKVYDCEYRSIRLARSEINMAYRTAEQTRWRQFDFVVGYEIKLSGSHPKEDICDRLAGKYPKSFVWTGWHPNCYTEEAMVLTAKGWKHFVDVEYDDMILSLNPNTRDVEWTSIVAKQCYPYNGEVVRFFNKSLECMVTPEHQMVFLNKNDGRIRKAEAREYRKGLGAFYRTCVHADKEERATIDINGEVWSFDDYCEFIGYWLADGSVAHASTVNLAQKEGEPARQCMIECIKRLGYEPHAKKDSIEFFRSPIVRYLRQFGKSYQKYIPQEILQASKRQIGIFLNAFIKCDGYSRKTKSFVGNHGCEFHSDKEERLFFTTSQQMAGQLCQLLLLIGHRPSFSIKEPSTHITKEGRVIKANYPCYVISECYSGTATVFDKEFIHYEGNVYDLTLAKNHIMYVCFNGRCFWGSNCMDYCIPLLKTEDEFFAEDDKPASNEVTDVPPQFKEWCTENWGRIAKAEKNGTLPYFLSDNKQYLAKAKEEFKEWEQFTNIIDLYSYAGSIPTDIMRYVNQELDYVYSGISSFDINERLAHLEERRKYLEEIIERGGLGFRSRIGYGVELKQIEKRIALEVGEKENGKLTVELRDRGFNAINARAYMESTLRDFDLLAFDDKLTEIGDEYEIYWKYKSVQGFRSAQINYDGFTENGGHVELKRGFAPDGNGGVAVSHSIFEIPEELQGKGISKKVMRACFEEYEHMGVTRVNVCANLTVGGLTWAKYGFYGEHAQIKQLIERRFHGGMITADERADALAVIGQYGEEIPMQKLGYKTYGERLLKGEMWDGHINLTDEVQMNYLHEYLHMSK